MRYNDNYVYRVLFCRFRLKLYIKAKLLVKIEFSLNTTSKRVLSMTPALISSIYPKNPIILASMAGITYGKFVIDAANAGAGAVSLGGFCIDEPTFKASEEIRRRGRAEFSFSPDVLINDILPSTLTELSDIPTYINIRFVHWDILDKFLQMLEDFPLAIPELNAHCRQPEITAIGAGQAMLQRPEVLIKAIKRIHAYDKPVSIKVRGNDPFFIKNLDFFLNDNIPEFLHVDAYQPSQSFTDINLLKTIRGLYPGFLIGNNSITNSTIALTLLKEGIDAISIARAAQSNPLVLGQIWHEILNLGYIWHH